MDNFIYCRSSKAVGISCQFTLKLNLMSTNFITSNLEDIYIEITKKGVPNVKFFIFFIRLF